MMAASQALVVDQVHFPAPPTNAGALTLAFFSAQFTLPPFAVVAVLLVEGFNAEGLLVAVDAEAETLDDQLLVFDTDSLQTGLALVLPDFVLDPVTVDLTL